MRAMVVLGVVAVAILASCTALEIFGDATAQAFASRIEGVLMLVVTAFVAIVSGTGTNEVGRHEQQENSDAERDYPGPTRREATGSHRVLRDPGDTDPDGLRDDAGSESGRDRV